MADEGRKTVVSIEDDEDFSKLLALMLKSEDVNLIRATGGEEGLRIVEDLQPDLVILDLMMPGMHGWQVFARMQEQKNLRGIPVVVVTALSSEADRVFGLDVAGVHAYLVKPISAGGFRTAVVEALGKDSDAA